jgi:hypothetical protein
VGCADVQRSAARLTDGASVLVLDVDGVGVDALAGHRQATAPCFDMGLLTKPALQEARA